MAEHEGPISTRQNALLVALAVAVTTVLAAWAGGTWWAGTGWWPVALAVVLFGVTYVAVLFGTDRFLQVRIQAVDRPVHDLRGGGGKDDGPVL